MFASLNRVAFYIGDYPVMKYGITMGTALAVSVFVLLKLRKRFYPEISEDTIFDLTFFLILFGIVGARLWYVILNFGYYSSNLLEILMINKGGISIQGALIGGVAAGFVYVKKHNLPFLKLADMYAMILPLGQAIGRWGNFFNSEAFGLPCDLPWKLYIPLQNRPSEYVNYEYFHPTFLYESILDFGIFLLLLFVIRKKVADKSGSLFFCYLFLYSLIRFFIEFIRTDSVLNIGAIPVAAIVCVVFACIGAVGFWKVQAHK